MRAQITISALAWTLSSDRNDINASVVIRACMSGLL